MAVGSPGSKLDSCEALRQGLAAFEVVQASGSELGIGASFSLVHSYPAEHVVPDQDTLFRASQLGVERSLSR
jgi:hypothetical protein